MKTGRKEIFTRVPSELTKRQVGDTTKQQLPPPHASSCIYGSLAIAPCLLKLKTSKQDCNLEWNSYWVLQVLKQVTWNRISAEFPRWDLKSWSDPVILLKVLYLFTLMFRIKIIALPVKFQKGNCLCSTIARGNPSNSPNSSIQLIYLDLG